MAILTHRSNLGGVGGGKTTRLFFQATGGHTGNINLCDRFEKCRGQSLFNVSWRHRAWQSAKFLETVNIICCPL